jgi:hypothetical protein
VLHDERSRWDSAARRKISLPVVTIEACKRAADAKVVVRKHEAQTVESTTYAQRNRCLFVADMKTLRSTAMWMMGEVGVETPRRNLLTFDFVPGPQINAATKMPLGICCASSYPPFETAVADCDSASWLRNSLQPTV